MFYGRSRASWLTPALGVVVAGIALTLNAYNLGSVPLFVFGGVVILLGVVGVARADHLWRRRRDAPSKSD